MCYFVVNPETCGYWNLGKERKDRNGLSESSNVDRNKANLKKPLIVPLVLLI